MPITQQRLLAVLSAGEDFQQALAKASSIARRERDLALAGRETEAQALANIALFLGDTSLLLRDSAGSQSALAIERAHFSTSRIKDNEREAKRIARRRAEPSSTNQGGGEAL